MLSDALCSIFNVAFNHQALNQTFDVLVLVAAVNDVLGNADLLEILLAGVVMVGIHNDRRVREIGFLIEFFNSQKIFVMIVRNASAGMVNIATENRMSIGISLACHFPSTIEEGVT